MGDRRKDTSRKGTERRTDQPGSGSMKPSEANPGLYLHIPFCSKICPYCDFAVLTGGPERRRRFSDHLVREISMWTDERSAFESIDTIYFGGGTPSALALEDLGRILEAARANLSIRDDARVFFEANPED